MQTGIFDGRQEIKYSYGRYGYTRSNGKKWHGGIDVSGIDDPTIYMPFYYDNNYSNPIKIKGTVTRARIITDKQNPTWEWGYYVCVQLDSKQTPDAVNFLYFCHCEKLLVKVGQRVSSGDKLAIMGNTGNAKLNNPPYKHCHLEVRNTATSKGLDPTHYIGHSNTVGTWGSNSSTDTVDTRLQVLKFGPLSSGDVKTVKTLAEELDLVSRDLYKESSTGLIDIGPVQRGDADRFYLLAVKLDLPQRKLYTAVFVE